MSWPQYQRQECTYRKRKVRLSFKECEILSILLLRKNKYVPYEDLIQALWPDPEEEPLWPEISICKKLKRLREKIPHGIKTDFWHHVGLFDSA